MTTGKSGKWIILITEILFALCISACGGKEQTRESANASAQADSSDSTSKRDNTVADSTENMIGKSDDDASNHDVPAADHKIYKYVRISSVASNRIYEPFDYFFGDYASTAWRFGRDGDSYCPYIIVEFDTNTGNASQVQYYEFYKDTSYPSDVEAKVNASIAVYEEYKQSDHPYAKDVTNINSGLISEKIAYLTANINPESSGFEQHIMGLLKGQDIECYKKSAFYDSSYNFMWCEDTEDHFICEPDYTMIEWSDTPFTGYTWEHNPYYFRELNNN